MAVFLPGESPPFDTTAYTVAVYPIEPLIPETSYDFSTTVVWNGGQDSIDVVFTTTGDPDAVQNPSTVYRRAGSALGSPRHLRLQAPSVP